ncbi:MAG: TolC family protein [Deltaproteobacteria bacterium]|nr:TolC family protein [Deltaproteobacteria bacterium]
MRFKSCLLLFLFSLVYSLAFPFQIQAEDQPLSLTLKDFIQKTFEHYEKIKIAEQGTQEALGNRWQSYSLALPNIRGSYSYTRNVLKQELFFPTGKIQLGFDNSHDFSVAVNQPLFGFGAIRHGISSASKNYEATLLNEKQTRAEVLFEAREAFFAALLKQEETKVARFAFDQSLEILKREEQRFRVGEIAEFDVNRAALDVENKKSNVLETEANEKLALEKLRRLAEISKEDFILEGNLEDFANSLNAARDTKNLKEKFENQNLLLKSLEKKSESAEEGRKASLASFFPSFSLFGNYSRQGQSSEDFFPNDSQFSSAASFGLNLNVPLFDGLFTAGKYKSAEAHAQGAAWEKQLQAKDLKLVFDQALSDAQLSLHQKNTQARALQLAETLYHQAQLRKQNGLISYIDLKDIQSSLEQARLAYLSSVYRYIVNWAKIDQMLGEDN